jgi:hypothetical protein
MIISLSGVVSPPVSAVATDPMTRAVPKSMTAATAVMEAIFFICFLLGSGYL